MEQDGPINFQALRAKFQEEATLAQARYNRPTIPEKPRHVPPPGGPGGPLPNGRNHAVENKTQAVPRVIFRSDLRSSAGKRPISFPPHTSPRTRARDGDRDMAAMHSSLEGHLPLVLRVRPKPHLKEPPLYSTSSAREPQRPTEPPPETPSSTAAKKTGLLLPFKASKPPKWTSAGGEEAAYTTYLPTGRPASAPPGEQEACPRGEDGPPSSPDAAVTSPSREAHGDSDRRLMSTLERARKKFSRKQVLMYVKGKGAPSPEDATATAAAAQDADGGEADFPAPSPVCLSQLACVSARPFFKVDKASCQLAWDKQLAWDRCGGPHAQLRTPPLRALVDAEVLGPAPAKPPRPPCVDLGLHPPARASPDLSRPPAEDPAPGQSTAGTPLLDPPDFPDFELSSGGGPEDLPPLDLASLEAEEFVHFDLPPPADPETSYFEAAPEGEPSDPTGFDLQAFTLRLNPDGPEEPLAPVPSGLPEPPDLCCCVLEPAAPESWCGPEDAAGPPAVPEHGTDPRTTGSYRPEEAGRAGHAALANGIEAPASPHQQHGDLGVCDNVYEDVETINRYLSSHNSQKSKDHKGGPKNPYGDSQQGKEEVRLNIWPRNPWGTVPGEHSHSAHPHFHRDRAQSPDHGEHKEQKKKERQRQEKEKKEQKEQEKRKTEMKKKFKVTGAEEPLYHAKVMVATKVRKKNDLLVTSGDTVSIIRTTNCPKGRWLARDAGHKYGYISVMNVELNIKEMLELGKKAQAAGRGGNAIPNADPDTVSISSRSSNHPAHHSSFTDDSEEWACEDETLSPSADSHSFHHQTVSMPDMMCSHASSLHTLSDANLEDLHTQTRHEALQKLVTFFQQNEGDCGDAAGSGGVTPSNLDPPSLCAVEEPPYLEREVDFTHLELLPPPPLYADTF